MKQNNYNCHSWLCGNFNCIFKRILILFAVFQIGRGLWTVYPLRKILCILLNVFIFDIASKWTARRPPWIICWPGAKSETAAAKGVQFSNKYIYIYYMSCGIWKKNNLKQLTFVFIDAAFLGGAHLHIGRSSRNADRIFGRHTSATAQHERLAEDGSGHELVVWYVITN